MGDERRDEADQRRADVYSSARIGAAAALTLVLVVLLVLEVAVPDYDISPGILLAPTPTPEPSPFPYADPPPAMFDDAACYHGVAKSFRGWTTTDTLNIPFQREGTVYAMVTRDVIPIGNWYKNSNVGGHKTRWWAQGVCISEEWDPGGMEFAPVNGTSFLEVDDGRHLAGAAP